MRVGRAGDWYASVPVRGRGGKWAQPQRCWHHSCHMVERERLERGGWRNQSKYPAVASFDSRLRDLILIPKPCHPSSCSVSPGSTSTTYRTCEEWLKISAWECPILIPGPFLQVPSFTAPFSLLWFAWSCKHNLQCGECGKWRPPVAYCEI